MAVVAEGGFDAAVLAGGLARRLEGADKPALVVGGATLLDRVIEACAQARDVVCVGPRRPTRRPVRWTREDPPGSGPVAALAAALELPRSADGAGPGPAPSVVVLAADLPFLRAKLIHRLWISSLGHDGAVLSDREGRDQWLAACYRREILTGRIAQLRAETGGTAGLSLRRLLAGLDLVRVPDPDGQSFDVDTWEDVRHVRRLVDGGGADQRPPGTEPDR
jgi:molybdopterin-guanine dinucleotide biosynthesis protein A